MKFSHNKADRHLVIHILFCLLAVAALVCLAQAEPVEIAETEITPVKLELPSRSQIVSIHETSLDPLLDSCHDSYELSGLIQHIQQISPIIDPSYALSTGRSLGGCGS